jgi:ABC-type multidrug transport system fused ATPase/permease subunit
MASLLVDGLRGMRELVQFDAVATQRRAITERSSLLGQRSARLRGLEGLALAGTEATILAATLVLLCLGAVLVMDGEAAFFALAIATVALMSSFGPVVALAGVANNLLQVLAAGERICSLLAEEPVVAERTDGVDLSCDSLVASDDASGISAPGIVCDSISFAYASERARPVFERFDLVVEPGQTLGIRGASGCGKSTLLRLMMRFWDVDSGTISIGDPHCRDGTIGTGDPLCRGGTIGTGDLVDIRALNTASLRRNQAFMMQETVLFSDSIANNIRVGKPDASDAEVEAACVKAALHDFVRSLPQGYETMAGELGDALSSGERQRIGLARAFLHDAPIVLLDEPTSNLDALNEGMVLSCLRKEAQTRTVVIVSHRASTMSIANKVLSL